MSARALQEPMPAFSRCYKGELPVIKASFAFSLPQTADLFMAVSNSLSIANISNLSVQNKVEVYVIYLKNTNHLFVTN